MNFSSMNNQTFTERFKTTVAEERRITTQILEYFREAEKRMLYAECGYSSLLGFAVGVLKYSEAAAMRRISAMRLMREMPEVKEKIETGELSLSTLTQAATFVRQSEKQAQEKFNVTQKREVLKAIEGQSSQKAEKILLQLNPNLNPKVAEKQRPTADGGIQLTVTLDAELVQHLEEVQILLQKKMQMLDLIKYLTNEQLQVLRKKLQKIKKAQLPAKDMDDGVNRCDAKAISESGLSLASQKRSPISIHVRRQLLMQSGYRCSYVDPISLKRCEERHYLEIEHVHPKAHGGSDNISNLEVLCGAHNKLRALHKLGPALMQGYLPSLR